MAGVLGKRRAECRTLPIVAICAHSHRMCQVSVKQTPLTEASDMKPSYMSGEGIGLCGEKVETKETACDKEANSPGVA